MHIISRRPFSDAAKAHPNQRRAILDVYKVLCNSQFSTPDEMRQVFPSLDNFKYRDRWWVFNIGGNRLRMIASIQFFQNRMYVKHILTHAEHDKICKRYATGKLP